MKGVKTKKSNKTSWMVCSFKFKLSSQSGTSAGGRKLRFIYPVTAFDLEFKANVAGAEL
jgi:hypothetical protein